MAEIYIFPPQPLHSRQHVQEGKNTKYDMSGLQENSIGREIE